MKGYYNNKYNMEQKKDNLCSKIIDKLGMLLLLSTIVTFNIIIGANEKGLRVLPISILMALNILYLIVLKLKSKNKSIMFKSKVDYLVLLFMLSTTLPLIFKTYASYSDSVEFVMKYFFIYSVYVLARNVIKEKKHIEYVIVTTLISSFFSVIFFYDYNNAQYLKGFMEWIDITYEKNTMFYGTFGYANTQAIYSALCIFFAMHRFTFNKNRVLKVIDVLYIIFELYLVWITDSRAVLILIGFTWIVMLVAKYRTQIKNHRTIVIIAMVLSILGLSILLPVALKVSAPIVEETKNLRKTIKYKFVKNQKYTLELELETIYKGESDPFQDSGFIIYISEGGSYFFWKKIASESLGEFKGIYMMEFSPTINTDSIRIKIENKYDGIIKLNGCYINGEKNIINYKYIPNDLAYILSGYTIGDKSILQRLQMYKDCMKMVKNSPIVGHGGNAWKNISLAYAEYRGALKECHSYFFELLISYGIVGLLAFLAFIIYSFVTIYKQCKNDGNTRKEKMLIIIGLLIILIHALIDFDMSFMLIQLMVYISIAILLRNNEQESESTNIKKHNIFDYSTIIFLIIILSLYVRADISKYLLNDNSLKHYVEPYNRKYYNEMIKDDIKNKKNNIEVLKEFQDYMVKEPYFTQNENYERYFNLINQNVDKLSEEELKEYLNFGIEKVKNVKVKKIMYFNFILRRTEALANAISNFNLHVETQDIQSQKRGILNNAVTELKMIINVEYDINIFNLESFEKNGYDDTTKENFKKRYKQIIRKIGDM